MRIWGIILVVVALGQFILAYYTIIDRIKPSKTTEILYYIMAGVLFINIAMIKFLS